MALRIRHVRPTGVLTPSSGRRMADASMGCPGDSTRLTRPAIRHVSLGGLPKTKPTAWTAFQVNTETLPGKNHVEQTDHRRPRHQVGLFGA